MSTSMKDIYEHIAAMRGADKPSSFEYIFQYLSERGFDPDDIKHAITYTKRKEHDELTQLKDEGTPLGTFGYLLSGIIFILLSLVSLFSAIRTTYIFFFSGTSLQIRTIELSPQGHIIVMVVSWVSCIVLLKLGVYFLRKQERLRVSYQQRKKQGLL